MTKPPSRLRGLWQASASSSRPPTERYCDRNWSARGPNINPFGNAYSRKESRDDPAAYDGVHCAELSPERFKSLFLPLRVAPARARDSENGIYGISQRHSP